MRNFLIAAATLLAACQPPAAPAPTPSTVDAIITAERAFAADAVRIGWVEASEAHAAPDAFVLQPGPTPAARFYTNIDPANRGDTSLNWGPEVAAASRSGDLGFTTGPFNGDGAAFGYYLTVWKRQPDGAWKWVYEGGTDVTTPLTVSADGEVEVIEPSAEGKDAGEDVLAAEAALATAAATDPGGALAGVMAARGRISRNNIAPATGPDGARAIYANGPAALQYSPPLRSEVSPDLVFTLGEVRWADGGGYYCRIWVFQDEGWKIAFDQIVERP
jgi:ketosteroid isomerase-like protein